MRMDLQYLIDRLETLVRAGGHIPMMSKIMMDEQELVDLIDQMRTVLPEEIRYAKHVLREKEQILADAQAQADDILRTAREQADLMIQREGLLKEARTQADKIIHDAQEESERISVGADNYARQVLTELEETLVRQTASVRKGLESLKYATATPAQACAAGGGDPATPLRRIPYPYTIAGGARSGFRRAGGRPAGRDRASVCGARTGAGIGRTPWTTSSKSFSKSTSPRCARS